jgi:hypothetical protein
MGEFLGAAVAQALAVVAGDAQGGGVVVEAAGAAAEALRG